MWCRHSVAAARGHPSWVDPSWQRARHRLQKGCWRRRSPMRGVLISSTLSRLAWATLAGRQRSGLRGRWDRTNCCRRWRFEASTNTHAHTLKIECRAHTNRKACRNRKASCLQQTTKEEGEKPDGRTNGWLNGQMDNEINKLIYRQICRGWMSELIDIWLNLWMLNVRRWTVEPMDWLEDT